MTDPDAMLTPRPWAEFVNSKMMWLVNSILHIFGWAIVAVAEEDGSYVEVYPAKCRYRGFDPKVNDAGYKGITQYMAEAMPQLLVDAEVDDPVPQAADTLRLVLQGQLTQGMPDDGERHMALLHALDAFAETVPARKKGSRWLKRKRRS